MNSKRHVTTSVAAPPSHDSCLKEVQQKELCTELHASCPVFTFHFGERIESVCYEMGKL